MADWLEAFYSIRIHILIRFGLWDSLLSLPIPSDTKLYCVTTAMMHYGKGVAFAALGNISDAEREKGLFGNAVEKVPKSRWLFNNSCRDILGVAEAMMDGEIAYRKAASSNSAPEGDGEFEVAWRELQKAIERDDGLAYDEPWGWMQPARHAYGALLLEQGELERAEAVYSADLGIGRFKEMLPRARRHPRNVWALHGYMECLRRLGRDGDGNEGEGEDAVKDMLRGAMERADVEIKGSCFCRVGGK